MVTAATASIGRQRVIDASAGLAWKCAKQRQKTCYPRGRAEIYPMTKSDFFLFPFSEAEWRARTFLANEACPGRHGSSSVGTQFSKQRLRLSGQI